MKTSEDFERAETLFGFLLGTIPRCMEGIPEDRIPRLTSEQAWEVVCFLKGWTVPDSFERCDVCECFYDSDDGGCKLDFGDTPYCFCDSCMDGREYRDKVITAAETMTQQAHRFRQARKVLLACAAQIESGDEQLSGLAGASRLRALIYESLGTG